MSVDVVDVSLDHLANLVDAARKARAEAAALIAQAELWEQKIRDEMGDANQASVLGVPVYSYNWKQSYAWRQFQDKYPTIASRYQKPKEGMELDREAVLRDHPDLVREFQTREFRMINRKPGS